MGKGEIVEDLVALGLFVEQEVRGLSQRIIIGGHGATDYTTKSSRFDLISSADTEMEERLAETLTAKLAGSTVLGEEGSADRTVGRSPSRLQWIIDPIDGTTNFVHGYPHLAVSVALRDQDQVLLGMVHNPFTGETWSAVAGQGAQLNGSLISVSPVDSIERSLVGFGLPYDRDRSAEVMAIALRIHKKAQDLRRSGSSALDIAYVACGRLDAYFEADLRPWDVSAAALVLVEAGGELLSWSGDQIPLGEVTPYQDVLATNNRIAADVLECIGV